MLVQPHYRNIGYIVYEKNIGQNQFAWSLGNPSPEAPVASSSDIPPDAPLDYFPTDIGHVWSYKITMPKDGDGLNHHVTVWPLGGDTGRGIETRGRYFQRSPSADGVYYLTMHIKAAAKIQGPLQYSEGYELAIDRDDLGIFEGCDHVYWAIMMSDHYQADLITAYSSDGPDAPTGMLGDYYSGEGYGDRVFFFGAHPGDSIGLRNENDSLVYMGPTTYKGKDALAFIRKVEAENHLSQTAQEESLEQAFTEEVVFVRGLGLVSLVQKVGSTVTMTWELEESPPSLPSNSI